MATPFTYGGQTILSHPIFVEAILPFLLIFTIVFAILQKSKILGEGKRQIDAIVALVTGLLVISFGQAVGVIVQLIPFLAVSLVIILVLLILLGSFTEEGKFFESFPKGLKAILTIIIVIAVIIAVLLITGAWDYVYDFIFITGPSDLLMNAGFVVIVIIAIAAVLWGSKGSSSKPSGKIS